MRCRSQPPTDDCDESTKTRHDHHPAIHPSPGTARLRRRRSTGKNVAAGLLLRVLGYSLNYADEPIAPPRQGFHEARRLSGVSQGVSQSLHGTVQAVVKIHEGVGRPQSLLDLLARYQLTGTLQQHGQDCEGLIGKAHAHALAAKLTRAQIYLEFAKPHHFKGSRRGSHDARPTAVVRVYPLSRFRGRV